MRRRKHTLRTNRTVRPQTDWLFFDTESRLERVSESTQRHHFQFGWAFYVRLNPDFTVSRRKVRFFTSPEELCEIIDKCAHGKRTLHIVAHNVQYDLQTTHLIPLLIDRGWELRNLYAKGLSFIMRMRKGKRRIVFEDGCNRLRGSIEDWGRTIGINKIAVDFTTVSREELIRRCYTDTHILEQATLRYLTFIYQERLGDVRPTISGQAFTAFRHRFMLHKIEIHDVADVLTLERAAYGGGMTRVFKRGTFDNDTFYLLDVNSMYPYVMSAYDYPCKLTHYTTECSIEQLRKLLEFRCVIAECRVRPKTPAFRCNHLSRITYPLCEFVGVFCTEELKRLLREDAIIVVHRLASYKKASLFTDYVDYFWQRRQKAKATDNKMDVAMCKQFLNSLYGKFGARQGGFQRCEDYDRLSPKTVGMVFPGETEKRSVFFIDGKCYVEARPEEAYNSFPAIAAEITANGRMYLWSLVETAGYENCYYTDTDSLIVNTEAYRRLQTYIADGLGSLKIQAVGSEVTVSARKDYVIADKRAQKGVSGYELVYGVLRPYREIWPKIRPYLKSDLNQAYETYKQYVNLQRRLYDGTVDPDGTVRPFTELPRKWT